MRDSGFYIGYLPQAPPRLAVFLRRICMGLALIAAAMAVLLVTGQSPFAESSYEFEQYREYRGRFEAKPYPVLITPDATFLLVAPWKRGLSPPSPPGEVSLRGALARRGADRLLEVLPGSWRAGSAATNRDAQVDLGVVTWTGEIVDSKCYLGVMNPGNGKVHRSCAARCISGGIPPALAVRFASGDSSAVLLVGEDGRALNREVLGVVAEPLEVSGRLTRQGRQLLLYTDPRRFRRLHP